LNFRYIKILVFQCSFPTKQGGDMEGSLQTLSLKEYLDLQKQEILGPLNMWLAGEKLGHTPTHQEAALFYEESGGAADFAKRHALQGRDE
jgi:hypothetical protein